MQFLFELFLGTQLTGVSTLLLSAVFGTRREAGVAFSAHGLVAVVRLCEQGQRRIIHTPTQAKDQVQCGFLLDVVIRQSAAVLELFSGKDQSLLVGGNALLVLDLGLNVVNGVAGLDIKRDCLARKGLHKDLHGVAVFR
jgi:hypothetical protein